MLPILLIIVSGLFAQSSDVVSTPEHLDQLLNDSTVEQQTQLLIQRDIEPKEVIKKSKIKLPKNKKLKSKKIKNKISKTKKLRAKKAVADKTQPITGGEGLNE